MSNDASSEGPPAPEVTTVGTDSAKSTKWESVTYPKVDFINLRTTVVGGDDDGHSTGEHDEYVLCDTKVFTYSPPTTFSSAEQQRRVKKFHNLLTADSNTEVNEPTKDEAPTVGSKDSKSWFGRW